MDITKLFKCLPWFNDPEWLSFNLSFSPLLSRASNQSSLGEQHHITLDFVTPGDTLSATITFWTGMFLTSGGE